MASHENGSEGRSWVLCGHAGEREAEAGKVADAGAVEQLAVPPCIKVDGVERKCTTRCQNPAACAGTVHRDRPGPVSWDFARGLLAEGTVRPIGHGDVRSSRDSSALSGARMTGMRC
ncbi:SsgA family sporulation/cell division regulator [Streptomyces chartreusis]|uniref:SsgA family sporulation/cell division regulator n=1 Tax=Streptomyces chartreusis TaxID=1969 RepID=UPI003868097A